MAGLRDSKRGADRFQISHLPDQDNVRILPKSVFERRREAVRIRADLALVHHALLVPVDELDGVLYGDDVRATFAVDHVHQSGQRGRLPGPGGARNEDQPAWAFSQRVEDRR